MNWKTIKTMIDAMEHITEMNMNQVSDMYIKIYGDGHAELIILDKNEEETCLHIHHSDKQTKEKIT